MKGKILVTAQFMLLGLLALTPNQSDSLEALKILSVVLLVCATLLLIKSFRDLGDALTPLPESKEGASLVTSGIYRYLRHPIYSALFILAAGLVFWKQSTQSFTVSVLLIGLLVYKSKYEDSLLIKKFPEAAQYQQTTPSFLPHLKKGKI